MTPLYLRLLDLCEAAGIRTLIGIPDPAFLALMVAAEARGWQVIAPHHEAAGGFIADAVTRLTGAPALWVGSPGPGFANALPAMVAAQVECAPVLFLGAQRGAIPPRVGRFQHVEQMGLAAGAVKYAGAITAPGEAESVMQAAIHAMTTGRPGPAYVEVAMPVIGADVAAGPIAAWPTPALPEAALAEAAALIARARCPVLLVGNGVHSARTQAALAALAVAMACAVIQTPGAGGFLPGLAPVTLPYGFSPVAAEAVAASDLVVAVGTQIGEQVHFGQHRHWQAGDAARAWVHIEADAAAIGVNRRIDVALVGDLRKLVPELTQRIAPRAPMAALDAWRSGEAARRAALGVDLPEAPSGVHPARLAYQASASLPEEGVLVRDGGAFVLWQMAYGAHRPADVLWSGNFAHLGTGLPYAIGAGVAAPGRPVLLLTGDSALLFHVAELETAARLGLPIVCVVAVDHQWGLEVGMYRRLLGPGSAETGAHWSRAVRFDLLAEALGCHGEYVTQAGALECALARSWAAARGGQPAVVHVAVDGEANAGAIPNWREFAGWYSEGMGY